MPPSKSDFNAEDLKNLSDLVSRMDERLRILSKKQKDIEKVIMDLTHKLNNLDIRMGNHDNRWNKIFDYFWKLGLMVIAGYILYMLGLQKP